MTTKTIFNIDVSLKKAVMKKAKSEGLTMSMILNLALKSYLSDEMKIMALNRSIARGRADIRAGRVISQEDLFKELGI